MARAQPLSEAVAARTGIRHESPQVLLLHHGQAVWSASHGAITTDAVPRALQEAADAASLPSQEEPASCTARRA